MHSGDWSLRKVQQPEQCGLSDQMIIQVHTVRLQGDGTTGIGTAEMNQFNSSCPTNNDMLSHLEAQRGCYQPLRVGILHLPGNI